MTPSRPAIVIVGGGPRGLLLVDRIAANIGDGVEIDVHVVDDTQIGPGRVWRTDQTRELCMNTMADAVTLFTDASVTMEGPVREGPTLHEWCRLALGDEAGADAPTDVGAEHLRVFRSHPVRPGLVADYRDELERQRPESHPSRALYGEYLRWCWERAVAACPSGMRVHEHLGRAVAVEQRRERDVVHLGSGEEIAADALVVAAGWLSPAATDLERRFAARACGAGLVWVRQGSPVDQDLAAVPDGADTIVRGLGMGFFDAMALLTIGRGGRFVADDGVGHGLRYEPSGREPRLLTTSPRGVPYRAKTLYGALPPRAPQRRLREFIPATDGEPIDFDREIWPLIVRDAFCAYYETLARVRPGAVDVERALPLVDAVEAEPEELSRAIARTVAPFVLDPDDQLDLDALLFPGRDIAFADAVAFDAWVARFVAHDLAEAERGAESAEKAALWSVASARRIANRLGTFGGFDAESRRSGFRRLLSIGAQAGSGPPAFRNRQLLALHAAGLVRFLGPGAAIEIAGGAFRAESPLPGSAVTATALIDALVRPHDAADSADPLMRALAETGRIRPFATRTRDGRSEPTRGVDVDPATSRAIGRAGRADRSLHIVGIPTEEAAHDTLISPMPGTDAAMLRESDRAARSLLRTALAVRQSVSR
ncbi:MAG: FAD/NAD(P)-binding protein [Microbacterium sp.]